MDRAAWRLLPSERVIWSGAPRPDVPLDRHWPPASALLGAFATVSFFFALLLRIAGMEGVRASLLTATYLTVLAVLAVWGPRRFRRGVRFLATDRRVVWRHGKLRRQIQLSTLSYARIRWHRSVAAVGHLELVCAVPFGPLARRQRIVLPDVERPDAVLALVQGLEPSPHGADLDLPLHERLSPGERVRWTGQPAGAVLGWQERATGAVGLLLLFGAMVYGHRIAALLTDLERHGLLVRSWEWFLLFGAGAITWAAMTAIGVVLLWYGWWRARRLGARTEYVVTDGRVLIRRGRVELVVDRRRIVDVAVVRARGGFAHLFLVLDGPDSRALATSGALDPLLPPRDAVPPVLFGVLDEEGARRALLGGETTERAERASLAHQGL